jgi:hypothetical protein
MYKSRKMWYNNIMRYGVPTNNKKCLGGQSYVRIKEGKSFSIQ